MKTLKKILKIFLLIIAILVIGFIGLIVYAIASDYKPDEKELIAQAENPSVLKDSLSISLLTWNIGYAGLDKDMDFFKDGGTKVITPKDKCLDNISLTGDFGFPTQLFYLDRCFMVNRYRIENGKELVLINTHNEAFDEGGNIRKAQMERLKEFVLNEYNSGNYVIAGGDWNQYPPDFKPAFPGNKEFTGQIGNFYLMGIESDYMPGEWEWIYDPATPSLRTVIAAYDPATTPTSVCDIFLISPNIESVSIKCHHLGFTNSDHNPVIIQVKLK